jgi:hypothetical protein
VVYCYELRYGVESMMVVVGVGDGGGYVPAWWIVCGGLVRIMHFSSWFYSFMIIVCL